jgi:putative SOS response-associated peptidase YedK
MCGRFVLNRQMTDLVSLFDIDVVGERLPAPSWNIAPGQRISVIIDSLPRSLEPNDFPEPVRRVEAAHWGLVPAGTKDPAAGPPRVKPPNEGRARPAPGPHAGGNRTAGKPAGRD